MDHTARLIQGMAPQKTIGRRWLDLQQWPEDLEPWIEDAAIGLRRVEVGSLYAMTHPLEVLRENPDIATCVPIGDGEILVNVPALRELTPEVATRIENQADPGTIGALRNWQPGVEVAKPGLIGRLMCAIETAARFMQNLATRNPQPDPWEEVTALEHELRSRATDGREKTREPETSAVPSSSIEPR